MSFIVDTQNSTDTRNIRISRVGIKDFKVPITLSAQQGIQYSIANVSMFTSLAPELKGTHMSRFITLISENKQVINSQTIKQLSRQICELLESDEAEIQLSTSFFISKKAPISQIEGLVDYQITYTGLMRLNQYEQTLKVAVPVTSLCPCSKEISQYGAHNQRSIVSISVKYQNEINPEELIAIAEKSASCELYSILKRPDEKYVTETAYENPKFVEDMVRDIAQELKKKDNILSFIIESENFESIHNHSAYAKIIYPDN